MFIALDIGNSNTVVGFMKDGRTDGTYRISNTASHTSDEYELLILQFLAMSGYRPEDVEDVIICSVVPQLLRGFKSCFSNFFGIKPLVIAPGLKTGIRLKMPDPRQLGSDILTGIVAAYNLYGGPALVIDMGTATTVAAVNSEGTVEMCLIAPGLETQAKSLSSNTAQLPHVELKKPSSATANTTETAMQTGLYYSFVGGIERMIKLCKDELNCDFTVVATGGLSSVIKEDCKLIDIYDPDLIFEGMDIIREKNRQNAGKF